MNVTTISPDFGNELFRFLLFFVPAYVANMIPPFFRKLPFGYPIDGGKTFRGEPIFGKNKTWRGLILGTIAGGIIGWFFERSGLGFVWWWGLALGFAALAGDAIKSFFKRQYSIKPGARWIPFDQLDYLIAAYLVSLFFVQFGWLTILAGFAVIFAGTVIVQIIGGLTKVKADGV